MVKCLAQFFAEHSCSSRLGHMWGADVSNRFLWPVRFPLERSRGSRESDIYPALGSCDRLSLEFTFTIVEIRAYLQQTGKLVNVIEVSP